MATEPHLHVFKSLTNPNLVLAQCRYPGCTETRATLHAHVARRRRRELRRLRVRRVLLAIGRVATLRRWAGR